MSTTDEVSKGFRREVLSMDPTPTWRRTTDVQRPLRRRPVGPTPRMGTPVHLSPPPDPFSGLSVGLSTGSGSVGQDLRKEDDFSRDIRDLHSNDGSESYIRSSVGRGKSD